MTWATEIIASLKLGETNHGRINGWTRSIFGRCIEVNGVSR